MARGRRVPTVGAKQLYPVQVAAPIRHLESKRAHRAAHREYAPTIRADRQEQAAVNNEYDTQAASYKGATGMVDQTLAEALAGLKGTGLKGSYLQQTKNELLARQGDLMQALPFLLAGVKEERGKALRESRANLLQDRASMQQAAAAKFNERLKELRGAGSSALKSAAEKSQSTGRDFKNALLTAENGYREILQAAKEGVTDKAGKAGNPIKPPTTAADWQKFAETVEDKAEGVDITTALKAVEALQRKLQARSVARSVSPF